MPKRKTLKAEKRKVLGRRVKKLRREGILPGNIYGKSTNSTAVQIKGKEFEKLFAETGETEVIDLQIDKEKKTRPVLIRDIQVDPVTNSPLHIDFMQVDLTEKVEAPVPIEFINEAPAVKESKGILLELLSEIEVEALPTNLPLKIEVDISGLGKVDDAIAVADLKLPKGVGVKTDLKELVCKIEATKAEEEPAAAEITEKVEAQQSAAAEDAGKSAGTQKERESKDEKGN